VINAELHQMAVTYFTRRMLFLLLNSVKVQRVKQKINEEILFINKPYFRAAGRRAWRLGFLVGSSSSPSALFFVLPSFRRTHVHHHHHHHIIYQLCQIYHSCYCSVLRTRDISNFRLIRHSNWGRDVSSTVASSTSTSTSTIPCPQITA